MAETSAISADRPIGVFDSGLGGLTVVRRLAETMPAEHIIYLGDSARVPYGIKSPDTIRRFAVEDARFLSRFDPKLIVVACNTASAAAIDAIRSAVPCTVVDVVTPGAAAAIEATGSAIGVVATEATIRSSAYQRALSALDPAREVHAVACPLLVPIVEEGRDQDDPIVTHVLCDYLRDLQRLRPGALILGCTHYPLLGGPIGKLMGPMTTLVASSDAAAGEVHRQLVAEGQVRSGGPGSLQCYTTDNPERFAQLAERFGGRSVNDVRRVGTDELESLGAD
jgi:glutamate racemase